MIDVSRAFYRRGVPALMRRGGGPRSGRPRGGGAPVDPVATAFALLGDGADVFLDADYGYAKDGDNKVSLLTSRVGDQDDETIHTVAQASSTNQPVWGATSPSGRRGLTFSGAQRLIDPLTKIAGLYDGAQGYSSLMVVAPSELATMTFWGFGTLASSSHNISVRTIASGVDRRARNDGSTTTTDGAGAVHTTSIECVSEVYTGSAYSSWIDGVAAISASANTRAPVCDHFALGCARSSAVYSQHFSGEFYALILSRTQWTTEQRQAREAAAKLIWGTP